MGGNSAIPCERKTRRRSMTAPAGPTSGNSAVQPPPCPPPRAGEGNVTSPSPRPSPRAGEGNVTSPSHCPSPRAGEGNVTSPSPCRPPLAGEGNVTCSSPIQRGEVIQGRQPALEAEPGDPALRGRRAPPPAAPP